MSFLVTGGGGYLGSRICNYLVSNYEYVYNIDQMTHGCWDGVDPLLDHPHYHLILDNILNKSAYRRVGSVETVVHLAAIVGEDACNQSPDLAKRVNVEGTKKILDKFPDAHFIYVSTCSVYGNQPGKVVTEDTPPNPLGLYAETKLEAEELVRESGGTVLRLGTLCGLSPKMRDELFVNNIAYHASCGDSLSIYGLDAYRPYLSLNDLPAVIKAASYNKKAQLYNVFYENLTKQEILDIAKKYCPNANWKIETKKGEEKKDKRDYKVDTKHYDNFATFPVFYSVEETFCQMLRHYNELCGV